MRPANLILFYSLNVFLLNSNCQSSQTNTSSSQDFVSNANHSKIIVSVTGSLDSLKYKTAKFMTQWGYNLTGDNPLITAPFDDPNSFYLVKLFVTFYENSFTITGEYKDTREWQGGTWKKIKRGQGHFGSRPFELMEIIAQSSHGTYHSADD